MHGLVPGESYVFRVQAVNVFGLSEESQESSPISVEPALGEDTHLHSAHQQMMGSMDYRVIIKQPTHDIILSR